MRQKARAFNVDRLEFPFLFGGAFIEADIAVLRHVRVAVISLPFRRGFH